MRSRILYAAGPPVRTSLLSGVALVTCLNIGAQNAIADWNTIASTANREDAPSGLPRNCIELNRLVGRQVANGHTSEAEEALSSALTSAADSSEGVCAGLALHNLAVSNLNSGRLADAERLAERALRVLERNHALNDPILLRPLQTLCAAQFEQAKTRRARESFERMRLIHAEQPQDRALVHGMAAAMFQSEGHLKDAEVENLRALDAWQEAGRIHTADAAAVLEGLGSLYIEEQRFEEARQALDRALAVFNESKDTLPGDLLTVLNLRATLSAKTGQWREAEADLRQGISIANRQPEVDPVAMKSLLSTYSIVLRKLHRGREAWSVEARLAVLQSQPAIVDVTELLHESKLHNEK
jgi:tetratricopeptide (TPR) repeat protein